MDAYEKDKDESEYEEQLNEIYGDISVCGMTYPAGQALRELDPIAFRCGLSDEPIIWCCSECDTEFDESCCDDAEQEANECCKEEETPDAKP